ncbi:hypothetical protein Pelo_9321 [Pelomyxa schiedti]|nr:hypothetical protein Pelo_9321 [Pelomyxa schiedti]
MVWSRGWAVGVGVVGVATCVCLAIMGRRARDRRRLGLSLRLSVAVTPSAPSYHNGAQADPRDGDDEPADSVCLDKGEGVESSREGSIVLMGQDCVVGSLMKFCVRFSGIADSEKMLRSLQLLVDQYPLLCGSLRWSKRDNKKVFELVWGESHAKWAPVWFAVLQSTASSPPPCTRLHMEPYVPSMPRGSFLAVNLVHFPACKCSYLISVVEHTLVDAAGWTKLFTQWAAISCGAAANSLSLRFSRSPSVLLDEKVCRKVEKRAGSILPKTQKDLCTLFSKWSKHTPLSGFLWTIPYLLRGFIFSQSTVFRFSSDTIQDLMVKGDCPTVTKNSALCAIIMGSFHLLSPEVSTKRGGIGVQMLFNLRGGRCGTAIPDTFTGNAILNLSQWIPISTLDSAATALKEEGPAACMAILAPVFQVWVGQEIRSRTGLEQLCWYSRVHHLGLDSKLGHGGLGAIAEGDALLDNVNTREWFELGFPREGCKALDGTEGPRKLDVVRPVEVCLPMVTMNLICYIVQCTAKGDRDVYVSMPKAKLTQLSKLWAEMATQLY